MSLPGQPTRITRAAYKLFEHMPTGPVQVGVVEHVGYDGVEYSAIRDGGYKHHPDLAGFVGQPMVIWKNKEKGRLELRAGDHKHSVFIRVLTEEEPQN